MWTEPNALKAWEENLRSNPPATSSLHSCFFKSKQTLNIHNANYVSQGNTNINFLY